MGRSDLPCRIAFLLVFALLVICMRNLGVGVAEQLKTRMTEPTGTPAWPCAPRLVPGLVFLPDPLPTFLPAHLHAVHTEVPPLFFRVVSLRGFPCLTPSRGCKDESPNSWVWV